MNKYNSCSLILQKDQHKNCLFLGDAQAAGDLKRLNKNKISSIISIGQETIPKSKTGSIKYYSIKLRDQKSEDIRKHFQWIIGILQNQLKDGNVLIHCYHGVSRSPSFVIAYIMKIKQMGYMEAFNFVKEKRMCIGPNEGFRKQLQIYQGQLKNEKNG